MVKEFASKADLGEKQITFSRLADNAYAYTAEGDPNTGVIIGDDGVMVIDTQATPLMAERVLEKIRTVTDKPVKYVVITHYHAVRVLGASAYKPEHVIASRDTYDLIVERGKQDWKSEFERFPRLFNGFETIPGLTWPTITFKGEMSLWMGDTEIRIMQLGRGHTKGDSVVWMPEERVLYSGDLVEYGATPYTGDAYLLDWPTTLDNVTALDPVALVPGRGDALTTPETIKEGIGGTRAFITAMYESVEAGKNLR
jgi:glyoxylase-like metal-dependent hydrolase (beta-lactamase superfamily II)